jgi:GTP-binding protein
LTPIYQRARFCAAAARLDQAPPDEGWEVAFAGRSNAGKSSAINTLCRQRQLARISKTPGRTQQLIFFALDDARRLVDLPGYGYAKVSETVKARWQGLMADYLQRRRSLAGLVVVMDIRHPLTAFDSRMLAWRRQATLPLLLLLTKADKLGRGAARAQLERVKNVVADEPGQVEAELFSAQAHQGVESVHALLDQWLGLDGSEDSV